MDDGHVCSNFQELKVNEYSDGLTSQSVGFICLHCSKVYSPSDFQQILDAQGSEYVVDESGISATQVASEGAGFLDGEQQEEVLYYEENTEKHNATHSVLQNQPAPEPQPDSLDPGLAEARSSSVNPYFGGIQDRDSPYIKPARQTDEGMTVVEQATEEDYFGMCKNEVYDAYIVNQPLPPTSSQKRPAAQAIIAPKPPKQLCVQPSQSYGSLTQAKRRQEDKVVKLQVQLHSSHMAEGFPMQSLDLSRPRVQQKYLQHNEGIRSQESEEEFLEATQVMNSEALCAGLSNDDSEVNLRGDMELGEEVQGAERSALKRLIIELEKAAEEQREEGVSQVVVVEGTRDPSHATDFRDESTLNLESNLQIDQDQMNIPREHDAVQDISFQSVQDESASEESSALMIHEITVDDRFHESAADETESVVVTSSQPHCERLPEPLSINDTTASGQGMRDSHGQDMGDSRGQGVPDSRVLFRTSCGTKMVQVDASGFTEHVAYSGENVVGEEARPMGPCASQDPSLDRRGQLPAGVSKPYLYEKPSVKLRENQRAIEEVLRAITCITCCRSYTCSDEALEKWQVRECSSCRWQFENPMHMQCHMDHCHPLELNQCLLCHVPVGSGDHQPKIEQHFQEEHPDSRLYHCYLCELEFSNRSCMRSHMLRHFTQQGEHECPHCHMRFEHESRLNVHKVKCHSKLLGYPKNTGVAEAPEKNVTYMCGTCGRQYEYEGTLRLHLQQHQEKVRLAHAAQARIAAISAQAQGKKHHILRKS